LTVAQFCQQEQISVPSFYSWKKRLAPQAASTATKRRHHARTDQVRSNSNTGDFAELLIRGSSTPAEARLPGGVTISLGSDCEIAALVMDRLLAHSSHVTDQRHYRGEESC
jgi:hypothetical protein